MIEGRNGGMGGERKRGKDNDRERKRGGEDENSLKGHSEAITIPSKDK